MLKVLVETRAGWEVCAEAENGQDALAKITEHRPDLVIMDMAMPVKDGLTASREISAAMPDIPILMHTLHYSPELELEAKKSGVRKVVPKAESGDGLLNAIAELLEQSSAPSGKKKRPHEVSALPPQEENGASGDDGNSHARKN
jgi:DNA-binding NarL/FixJ family response regulator